MRVMHIDTGAVRYAAELEIRGRERNPREVVIGRHQTHVVVLCRESGEPVLLPLTEFQRRPDRYSHPHSRVLAGLKGAMRPRQPDAWPILPRGR